MKVSESFHIKGIALLVDLESDVMLLIGNYSPELLYVDGRDICSDQEGWIKSSESENIQSNLKGGFLGLECGAQSVVATANHKTLFPWNKSIVQSLLLFFSHAHDSAKKELIQFIYNQVYIVTANSNGNVFSEFGYTVILQIRALMVSANSDPTANCEFEPFIQSANLNTKGSLGIRVLHQL
ncbi:hypothetical protein Tco_1412589 [Tanacetum coccineum]